MLKFLGYSWLGGILAFILTVIASASVNPWFDLFSNAFSDLGSSNANSPWIYNYGLIITAIFVMLYSVYITLYSQSKLETIGGAFFFIAGVFLFLIGIFPAGTRPHVFVSTYFFVQSDFSIFAWALGILKRNKGYGLFSLIISIIGPVLGFTINWPSVAIQEAFGISLIAVWALLVFFYYKKADKLPTSSSKGNALNRKSHLNSIKSVIFNS